MPSYLRHFSRAGQRLFHAGERQRLKSIVGLRQFCVETSKSKQRLSREERHELAMQFVEKYKSTNNGQLPGITTLRKEIGGSYQILKEIMESIEKLEPEPNAKEQKTETEKVQLETKQTDQKAAVGKETKQGKHVQVKKMESKSPEESILVGKDKGRKSSSNSKENKLIMEAKQVGDSSPIKGTSKAKGAVIATDTEDDDSDVAAPEYNTVTAQSQTAQSSPQVEQIVDMKKLKAAHSKRHEPKSPHSSSATKLPKKDSGLTANIPSPKDTAAQKKSLALKTESAENELQSPLLNVVRLSNLPSQISETKIRSSCEEVGSISGIQMRRKGIADVQFSARDNKDIRNIIDRLRNVTIDQRKLDAFLAPKFNCGKDTIEHFKPQDGAHFRRVRELAFNNFEHCFKQLYGRVQDCRELLSMKRDL